MEKHEHRAVISGIGQSEVGRPVDRDPLALTADACLAAIEDAGLRREDIDEAVSAAIEKMRTVLSIHNCHAYLSDLPQDVTVVSVEPVASRLSNPNRFRMP